MKPKNIVLIIVGILIIATIFLLVKEILGKIPEEGKDVTIVEKIEDYNYYLENRDNKIYQDEFKNLKINLTGTEVNYEEYAKSIAKMFIVDFYTLENKITKYDIGGLDFLLSDNIQNFKLKASDTIYKYIKDNSDGKRVQSLPTVGQIEVNNLSSSTFKINDDSYDSYIIELNWEYTQNEEYDTSAILTIINKDNKLYVVEEKRVEG